MATEGRATTGKGYERIIFLRCPFYIYTLRVPPQSDRPHPLEKLIPVSASISATTSSWTGEHLFSIPVGYKRS